MFKAEKDDIRLTVEQDDNPIDPRNDDNLGYMLCFEHPDYTLGDTHRMSNDEIVEYVKSSDVISLPLYLLDHSGLAIQTTKFPMDPQGWDTTFMGYITTTKDDIRREYSVKRISKQLLNRVISVLESEVETYNQYLQGDIWWYSLVKVSKCACGSEQIEEIDSCSGFYGIDWMANGLLDQIPKQYQVLVGTLA